MTKVTSVIWRWLAWRLVPYLAEYLATRGQVARVTGQLHAQVQTAKREASAARALAQYADDDLQAFAKVLRDSGFTVNPPR